MAAPREPGPRPPLDTAAACRRVGAAGAIGAILVEGWSDQAAVEALARRRGGTLDAAGIVVLPIGGATNLARFAQALGPQGIHTRLAGLCDATEQRHLWGGLERAGLGVRLDRPAAEALGFFVCDADLEDELIRALGGAAVERVLDAQGELGIFRRFQSQPAQRGRDLHAQLRRFMGTRSGRKIRYGALLVDALAPSQEPPPLRRLFEHVNGWRAPA